MTWMTYHSSAVQLQTCFIFSPGVTSRSASLHLWRAEVINALLMCIPESMKDSERQKQEPSFITTLLFKLQHLLLYNSLSVYNLTTAESAFNHRPHHPLQRQHSKQQVPVRAATAQHLPGKWFADTESPHIPERLFNYWTGSSDLSLTSERMVT